jgi:hypothetical protein
MWGLLIQVLKAIYSSNINLKLISNAKRANQPHTLNDSQHA